MISVGGGLASIVIGSIFGLQAGATALAALIIVLAILVVFRTASIDILAFSSYATMHYSPSQLYILASWNQGVVMSRSVLQVTLLSIVLASLTTPGSENYNKGMRVLSAAIAYRFNSPRDKWVVSENG